MVLDGSGSMSSQKDDIVGGVNETIKYQRSFEPETNHTVRFNLVTFNDSVKFAQEFTLADVPLLTEYYPMGGTALFDAMGMAMDEYKDEKNVIMIIATDGQENASKRFSYKNITDRVAYLREESNWNFIYIAQGLDTFTQGNSIGLSTQNTGCNNIAVGNNEIGSTLCGSSFNSAVCEMRKCTTANVKIGSSRF